MQKITPFLWFDNNAEEAMNFYVSVFKHAKVLSVSRYPEGSPAMAGKVMVASFEIEGQLFNVINGGSHYKINEAISFVVSCENQEEVDYYWDNLTSNGGQAVQCGWLKDPYGVSWQVVPTALGKLMARGPEVAQRVMAVVMKSVKLNIAEMEAAAAGV